MARKRHRSPTTLGYSSYANGVFTVRGAGNDIWDDTDEFHYVYQTFSGDGTVIARVTSQDAHRPVGQVGHHDQGVGDGRRASTCCWPSRPSNGDTFQYNFNGDGGSCAVYVPQRLAEAGAQGRRIHGLHLCERHRLDAGRPDHGRRWPPTSPPDWRSASHQLGTLNTTTFDNVSVDV